MVFKDRAFFILGIYSFVSCTEHLRDHGSLISSYNFRRRLACVALDKLHHRQFHLTLNGNKRKMTKENVKK
ncbi:hypothetical protein J3E69DRAFT_341960 [Trichoderma sp. SZMC 28015]